MQLWKEDIPAILLDKASHQSKEPSSEDPEAETFGSTFLLFL